MIRLPWNNNWKYRELGDDHAPKKEFVNITLPFDAAWRSGRDPQQINGSKKGYFKNGKYEFIKIFSLSEIPSGKKAYLEFEGVYQNAFVYLNGTYLGFHPNGYTEFAYNISDCLVPGNNYLQLLCSTGDDSRWYSGAGPYRSVNLLIGSAKGHFGINGLKITTKKIDGNGAIISLHSEIIGEEKYVISYSIFLKGHEIVSFSTSEKICEYILQSPSLWSDEEPNLYTIKATLLLYGEALDTIEERFGVRTIQLSAKTGLLINGKETKLRGTCVHHDNGIVGAISCKELETRKIKALKEAGFNAIRIAHHPAGRALLEACDEQGVYVLEEAFDQWHYAKSSEDYARCFDDWWQRDVSAMVNKSYNHPSVIIYSIGNEVADCFNQNGAKTGEIIANYLRQLDDTRYITNAINGIMVVMKALEVYGMQIGQNLLGGGDVNDTMNAMRARMKEFHTGETMERMLQYPASYLDLIGYNYMPERYGLDEEKNPNRVIVGTESYPSEMNSIWSYIFSHHNVIGDFAWIGLDYLGEAGIGKIAYEPGNLSAGIYGEYPYLTAGCGDIDILLHRHPASYFREIVFGKRKSPYIVVYRPRKDDKKAFYSLWGYDDVAAKWDYPSFEGEKVMVEVYSSSKKISLYLNSVYLGEKEVSQHKAIFEIVYHPGILKAIDSDGNEHAIATPRQERNLIVESSGENLRFIDISIQDGEGKIHENDEVEVEIEIANGELLGFGNAQSKTEATFLNSHCKTYEGRCAAVIAAKEGFRAKIKAVGQEKEVN